MHTDIKDLFQSLRDGSFRAVARAITMVENNLPGSDELLFALQNDSQPVVVGITGPPGAGKSTLVNALIREWKKEFRKIAVIAVDPSSPFNYGSLLGDRIRMAEHYNDPNIFIRSLATRGSLGGLNARIIEITDIVKAAGFDRIIIETVGVGQSEVEIAGLADCTVVVLVPEAGDEVQTLKSGIMEIADIFVVNKSDREGSELFLRNLRMMIHDRNATHEIPVLNTVASNDSGIPELAETITAALHSCTTNKEKKLQLAFEKCYHLILQERMRDVNTVKLKSEIQYSLELKNFNIYRFSKGY